MKKRLLAFLLVTFQLVSYAQYNSAVHGVPEIEYNALVAFYRATEVSYYAWLQPYWLSNTKAVSEWGGITVENGHVTRLNVIIENSNSYLPDEIYNLLELKELTIVNGRIYGPISPKIANLKKLEILSFMNGTFYDGFPKEIKELTNLKELDLSGFRKSEPFPNLSNLKRLRKLVLNWSNFTGEFPLWLTQMDSLQYLDLESDMLTGKIPYELNNMNKLLNLYLGGNNFDSNTFPDLSQMDSLKVLSLDDCNITGEIPVSLTQMKNITSIDLGKNHFSGKIPGEFANMPNLESLQLYSNNFDPAPIPDLSACRTLTSLNLSNCNLVGEIPTWMAEHLSWTYLNLWENELTGNIPEELFLHKDLYLFLLKNNFSNIQFTSETSLDLNLSITENKLEFDDIIPVIRKNTWANDYSPQDTIGIQTDTVVYAGSNYLLNINSQYQGNLFQWFKNGNSINSPSEKSAFLLENISESDTGAYTCQVKNPLAPDLTLYSFPINLSMKPCISHVYQVDVFVCEGDSFQNYTSPGTYTDTLSDFNGCDSIIITTINYYPKINETEDITICNGENYLGHEQAGTFVRTLSSVSGCDSIVTTRLHFFPENKTTITRFADTLRCDRNYQKYFWYFENNFVENSDFFRLDIVKSGNYYVVGMDENGCLNQSMTYYFSPVGVDEIKYDSGYFSVFPNPSKGKIRIKTDSSLLPVSINISNMFGEVIFQIPESEREELFLDMSQFPKSFYIVTVNNDKFSRSKKIILK